MQVKTLLFIVFVVLLSSCAAPRVINQSGKVTPKGNIVAGASYTANVPTKTIDLMANIVKDNIINLANKDSITLNGNLENINKAAIAQAIDPFASGYDFYIRAGVAKRLELGYKLAGRANTFNAQYQFLGPLGEIGAEEEEKLYGSIGLQYSWQSYRLPSFFGEIQNRLGYRFGRNDILLPLIFSYSFGNEEEYGALAFGIAASYTNINYATQPEGIYDANGNPVFSQEHKESFTSFGGFINLKAGYRYVYLIPSLSIFYQNYGDYKLINGDSFNFKGLTIVPSLSLQIRLNFNKAN